MLRLGSIRRNVQSNNDVYLSGLPPFYMIQMFRYAQTCITGQGQVEGLNSNKLCVYLEVMNDLWSLRSIFTRRITCVVRNSKSLGSLGGQVQGFLMSSRLLALKVFEVKCEPSFYPKSTQGARLDKVLIL